MKQISAYQVHDEKIFASVDEARNYLTREYEALKMQIVDEVIAISSRQQLALWLHENANKLARLKEFKNDYLVFSED